MHTTTNAPPSTTGSTTVSPSADRVLTWSLAIAPFASLLTDCLYAARGWDDGDAGGVHVLAAVLYGFATLRIVTWATGRVQAAALVAAVVGAAGNVAYGFNTIHVALGAVDLTDAPGPGAIIKPLGLFFPLSLLLSAVILAGRDRRVDAVLVAGAAVLWPVAHIGNIAPLAIGVNLILVCAVVPLARSSAGRSSAGRG